MKQAPIIPLSKFPGKSLPFKVQTIKNFIEEHDEINEGPHSHNYYEMVWLTGGEGTLYADMQEHLVDHNTIFFLRPGQPHQFSFLPEMEGFVFSFTDGFYGIGEYDFDMSCQASLNQLFAERRVIKFSGEMEGDMSEIVLKMMKEFENKFSSKMELLKRYFKIFLIYVARGMDENIGSSEQSRETELVKKFMESLEKNFKEKKQVSDYAGMLLVSPNYLNRIVKRITGMSAGHQIRQRVVLEAKRMGRYSDAGMKEIAYNLGFLDSAHFSKFFKTFGGLNFTDFKRAPLVLQMEQNYGRA
jgi:AraC family transcriptional regulator, transcriptional activator of pobA